MRHQGSVMHQLLLLFGWPLLALSLASPFYLEGYDQLLGLLGTITGAVLIGWGKALKAESIRKRRKALSKVPGTTEKILPERNIIKPKTKTKLE